MDVQIPNIVKVVYLGKKLKMRGYLVVRGLCYLNAPVVMGASANSPEQGTYYIGFRLVKENVNVSTKRRKLS